MRPAAAAARAASAEDGVDGGGGSGGGGGGGGLLVPERARSAGESSLAGSAVGGEAGGRMGWLLEHQSAILARLAALEGTGSYFQLWFDFRHLTDELVFYGMKVRAPLSAHGWAWRVGMGMGMLGMGMGMPWAWYAHGAMPCTWSSPSPSPSPNPNPNPNPDPHQAQTSHLVSPLANLAYKMLFGSEPFEVRTL